jgi:hypothetical protein
MKNKKKKAPKQIKPKKGSKIACAEEVIIWDE